MDQTLLNAVIGAGGAVIGGLASVALGAILRRRATLLVEVTAEEFRVPSSLGSYAWSGEAGGPNRAALKQLAFCPLRFVVVIKNESRKLVKGVTLRLVDSQEFIVEGSSNGVSIPEARLSRLDIGDLPSNSVCELSLWLTSHPLYSMREVVITTAAEFDSIRQKLVPNKQLRPHYWFVRKQGRLISIAYLLSALLVASLAQLILARVMSR